MKQKCLMIQMDASPEVLFGLKKRSLIIAIDDADGEIIDGNFSPTETTFSCMNVIKPVLKKRGPFNLLYVDKSHYRKNLDVLLQLKQEDSYRANAL